ncbi:MAG: hypothetical protein M0C28_32230 [Candidatus Moduliflexus flocculans]|nr:hypothetical protein [Candidatus Moduliflexus flocculans]
MPIRRRNYHADFRFDQDPHHALPGRVHRRRSAAPDLGAQWYGRNKVQYQKFDFKIMKTRHFDVYLLPPGPGDGQDGLPRWPSAGTPACPGCSITSSRAASRSILYGSSPEFQQTTVIPEILGEGTGGVTESFKRRIVLPYGASLDRDRPRHRPRARPRLPVRHHRRQGALRPGPRATTRTCASRSGSSRAWPSTCPSARSTRTPSMWMRDAVRQQEAADRSRSSTTPTSSSPTAGARPSGPTSPGAGATRSSAR